MIVPTHQGESWRVVEGEDQRHRYWSYLLKMNIKSHLQSSSSFLYFGCDCGAFTSVVAWAWSAGWTVRWRTTMLSDTDAEWIPHTHCQQMPFAFIPCRITNHSRGGGVVKTARVKSTSAPKGYSIVPVLAWLAWSGLVAVMTCVSPGPVACGLLAVYRGSLGTELTRDIGSVYTCFRS